MTFDEMQATAAAYLLHTHRGDLAAARALLAAEGITEAAPERLAQFVELLADTAVGLLAVQGGRDGDRVAILLETFRDAVHAD